MAVWRLSHQIGRELFVKYLAVLLIRWPEPAGEVVTRRHYTTDNRSGDDTCDDDMLLIHTSSIATVLLLWKLMLAPHPVTPIPQD